MAAKTLVGTPDPPDDDRRSYFTRILQDFTFTAPELTPAELPNEQQEDEAYSDYRARMNMLNVGDVFGASYDGAGLPDWRNPVHPVSPEITPMENYAAERQQLGIRNSTSVAGFEGANPRSHNSPYEL